MCVCVCVCVLVLVGYLGAFILGGSVLIPPYLYIYVPSIENFEKFYRKLFAASCPVILCLCESDATQSYTLAYFPSVTLYH